MWVEFVGSLLCTPPPPPRGSFPGTPVFPSPQKFLYFCTVSIPVSGVECMFKDQFFYAGTKIWYGTPKSRYRTYVFLERHGKFFVCKQNKQKAHEAAVPEIIGVPSKSLGVCTVPILCVCKRGFRLTNCFADAKSFRDM